MVHRKTIVVTGASDGIGRAAAVMLAKRGQHVVVVGRNPERTRSVAEQIEAPWHVADFGDLAQVRRLAQELTEGYPQIDVLANNAGGAFPANRTTKDGFDMTIQVDLLAPFLLTNLLLPRLLASHAAVVNTSSSAADWGSVSEPELNSRDFGTAAHAYGTAKLMDLMFAMELQERYGRDGLNAVAFHPGVIASSFGTNGSPMFQWLYALPLAKRVMRKPDAGAQELVRLSLGTPGRDWPLGGFTQHGRKRRIPKQARDAAHRKLLWNWAARTVGLG